MDRQLRNILLAKGDERIQKLKVQAFYRAHPRMTLPEPSPAHELAGAGHAPASAFAIQHPLLPNLPVPSCCLFLRLCSTSSRCSLLGRCCSTSA